MRPSFTLGIEEEYQTIDPVTRDLRSHIQTEMLAQGKMRLQERVKAEMHTSVVEVGTRVCRNINEAREDIYELRREMTVSRSRCSLRSSCSLRNRESRSVNMSGF